MQYTDQKNESTLRKLQKRMCLFCKSFPWCPFSNGHANSTTVKHAMIGKRTKCVNFQNAEPEKGNTQFNDYFINSYRTNNTWKIDILFAKVFSIKVTVNQRRKIKYNIDSNKFSKCLMAELWKAAAVTDPLLVLGQSMHLYWIGNSFTNG